MNPEGAAGHEQPVAEAAPAFDREIPAHADIAAKLDLEQRRHRDLVEHVLLIHDGRSRPDGLGFRVVDFELGSHASAEAHSDAEAGPSHEVDVLGGHEAVEIRAPLVGSGRICIGGVPVATPPSASKPQCFPSWARPGKAAKTNTETTHSNPERTGKNLSFRRNKTQAEWF